MIIIWIDFASACFGQNVVREDPQFVMDSVGHLNNDFSNHGCPDQACDFTLPRFKLSQKHVSQSEDTKRENWQEEPLLLVGNNGEDNDVENGGIHHVRASSLIKHFFRIKIHGI